MIASLRDGGDSGRIPRLMRNLIAVCLSLGLLAIACGSSNVQENSCTDEGAICVKTGAACGDTLPFTCRSGGVCCSPTSQGSSDQPGAAAAQPSTTVR